MARIHVIYDPQDKVVMLPDHNAAFGFKVAVLTVRDDIKNIDIYHQAKKLAELLLEQL
jgi:predicted N-formylglutamate amidohydrolase